jgi:hypothetical protein
VAGSLRQAQCQRLPWILMTLMPAALRSVVSGICVCKNGCLVSSGAGGFAWVLRSGFVDYQRRGEIGLGRLLGKSSVTVSGLREGASRRRTGRIGHLNREDDQSKCARRVLLSLIAAPWRLLICRCWMRRAERLYGSYRSPIRMQRIAYQNRYHRCTRTFCRQSLSPQPQSAI